MMVEQPARKPLKILVLGASYGALLASKIALAGHDVIIVARAEEAEVINDRGLRVRSVAREGNTPVELARADMNGTVTALTPIQSTGLEPDLVFLAMQEPQYAQPEIARLMALIADARVPSISIMNLPPSAFLRRLPGFDMSATHGVYRSAEVWNLFSPDTVTAASPDPQAMRPEPSRPDLLQVTLPTNIKVAPFASPADQEKLERLAADIGTAFVTRNGQRLSPRVRLVPYASLFVPLAKWPMLITGNCRCVQAAASKSIRDAVWDDIDASRKIYEAVAGLCRRVGASPADLVAFNDYAAAARSLTLASSLARGLCAGATAVERIDLLIRNLAARHSVHIPGLDTITDQIESKLIANR